MKYYPAFLRIAAQRCLVIGGGRVAEQKVASLLNAGGRVTVISPQLTAGLDGLAADGRIEHVARAYRPGDIHGYFIVIAATTDAAVQRQVAAEAAAATGVLLNVVDRPELCDFIVPSIMERGDLMIATSTSGKSPALARRIRQDLEARFGPEYAQALVLLGRLRDYLAHSSLSVSERKRILTSLVESPLLDHLQHGESGQVDRLLAETLGNGVSLSQLGVDLH